MPPTNANGTLKQAVEAGASGAVVSQVIDGQRRYTIALRLPDRCDVGAIFKQIVGYEDLVLSLKWAFASATDLLFPPTS